MGAPAAHTHHSEEEKDGEFRPQWGRKGENEEQAKWYSVVRIRAKCLRERELLFPERRP